MWSTPSHKVTSPPPHRLLIHWLSVISVWILLVHGEVRIDSDLDDVVVHVGDEARFLCLTSPLPSKYRSDPVTVHWKFQDRVLKSNVNVRGDRITSESFKNRHVLVIRQTRQEDEGDYMCVFKTGEYQDIAVGKLTVQSVPDPPSHVVVQRCFGNEAELSWRPGPDNGAKILKYSIQFNISDQPDTWYDFYDDVSGQDRQTFVQLSPYGTYSFRVLARNEVGQSPPSHVTSGTCTTPPDRPDRNPRIVKTKTDKQGFLVIEWEPLRRLSFHGPGFRYQVLWRWKGSLAWNSADVEGSYAHRFQKEVDRVYTTFQYQVQAVNQYGEAHQPPFIYQGRSFEAEPQITVSGVRLDTSKTVTFNTAHFVWEAVDPNDPAIRGKFRGYKIIHWHWQAGEERDNRVSLLIPGHAYKPGQEVHASLTDLPAHSAVGVKVVVVNTHYQGPPSQVVEVHTPEGVPSPVRRLITKSVTSTSVTLSWFPPLQSNGILTGYNLGYQEVLGSRLSHIRLSTQDGPNKLWARIGGLKPQTRYRIHIAAKTTVGPGKSCYLDVQTKSTALDTASTASDQASSLLEVNRKSDEIQIDRPGNKSSLPARLLSQPISVALLCLLVQLIAVFMGTSS